MFSDQIKALKQLQDPDDPKNQIKDDKNKKDGDKKDKDK